MHSKDGGSAAGASRSAQAGNGTPPGQPEGAGRKLARELLGGTPGAVGLVVVAVVGTAIGNLLTRYPLFTALAVAGYALAVLALYYWDSLRRALRRKSRPAPVPVAPTGAVPVQTAPRPSWRGRGFAMAVAGVLAACGYVLGYWVIGNGFAHGAGPGVASLLVTVAVAAAVVAALRWRRGSWPPMFRYRTRAALACCTAAAGLSAGVTLGSTDLVPPCPAPVELRVLTSSDALGAVQAAIPGFEQDEPAHLHTACYAVDVTAYAAPSDSAAGSALAAGWGQAGLGGDGPRPDIWIPGSSAESSQADVPGAPRLTVLGSIASSPLVVAVPDQLAGKYSLDRTAQHRTLPALYGELTRDGIGLAMPSPELSQTARLQIAGLYPALSQGERRLIEASGSFPPDSGNLLCGAAQAAEQDTGQQNTRQPAAAYLVSEAALINSNAGQLTGGACGTLTAAPPTLTALYPAGAAALDFPFTIVSWGGEPAAARTRSGYEADFYHWLTGQAARGALRGWGLRPPGCGPLSPPPPGIAEAVPACPTADLPSPPQVASALADFRQAQAPVHLLVGIDDSEPMQPYLPQITAAVDAELGPGGTHIGGSFGVWAVPGRGNAKEELVRFGPAGSAMVSRVPADVGVLTGHGHSADYDMLADAAGSLYGQGAAGPRGLEPINAVVLLTDGDGYPQGDPGGHDAVTVTGTFDRPPAGRSPVKLFVIAFGPAGCAESVTGPSLAALADGTGGTCLPASGSDTRQLLAQVVGQISAGG